MSYDAKFEDAIFSDQPLRLGIETPEDLEIASALVQDAVGLTGEISWMPKRRRLALLVNRFRWEDHTQAERQARDFERVRSALVFDNVLAVRANGLDPSDRDTVFSILRLGFEMTEEPSGTVSLALAGDGALALDVEVLNARILDLTRPWAATRAPDHKLDEIGE